jgi:hypothetical protein
MNFDQFAATFQNPDRDPCRDLSNLATTPVGDVVVAGQILSATKDSCCLSINGAVYEVAATDVIDIQFLSPEAPPERPEEKKGTKASEASEKRGPEKTAPKEAPPSPDGPRVVLIKVNGNAPMWRRIPVQAALVAAVGTWVSVVAAPTAA